MSRQENGEQVYTRFGNEATMLAHGVDRWGNLIVRCSVRFDDGLVEIRDYALHNLRGKNLSSRAAALPLIEKGEGGDNEYQR